MRYEIRAMSFAEILDQGFRLVRDHFVPIVGLAATLQVPLAVLQAWAGGSLVAHSVTSGRILAGVLMLLGLLVVAPAVGAAVTFALGETYLGHPPTMRESLGRAFRILLPLTGTMLLLWLLIAAAGALFVVPALVLRFVVLAGTVGPLLLVGIALVTVAYVGLGFMLATQVMVLEHAFGVAALKRSAGLMRGNLLRGAGVTALGALIVGVVGGVLQLALHFVPFVGPVGSGLARAAATAYTSAVLVVLYFDIRCRKEAFDLEHLARVVGG
jgi:hypothetical protein